MKHHQRVFKLELLNEVLLKLKDFGRVGEILFCRKVDNESGTPGSTEEHMSWVDFINATYGSLADDPLDEIDNTHLPPPVRDEVE